ncbi:ABC transporter substrate-binding protein [Sphingobium sp. H33]|uniref:ABC transporter substrate-binding protein n=1 Tax=Sphingobium nicotianae TaxID=2782607 RepID=A0A9X1AI22_9SPHN|nr:ABC transporter substrate-binding protein [Sphingobium nicotianae]
MAGLLGAAACDVQPNDSPVKVDVIGHAEQAASPLRDSNAPAAKVVLGAVAQGLLSYDGRGEIVDALAESWIVEDGGQSYIFRLKRLHWPDGELVKAEEVARLLRERMRANPLSLAGLKPEVRAMTDRVIEIRLDVALPAFLQLLAQPQFGILSRAGGTGPYLSSGKAGLIALKPISGSQLEGEEAREPKSVEQRLLEVNRGALAIVRFKAGQTDLVLGGRFQHLRLVPAAGLTFGDLRVDPVSGLLGLAFTGSSDFLQDITIRDALSRVVDRAAFAAALGLQGWHTADTPLPAPLELDRPPSVPAWSGQPMADRIASARQIVARWTASQGDPPVLRIALPEGAGASLLFVRLARDFSQIGVRVDRVPIDAPADLRLIDEVAPFDSALWYLSRLDCAAKSLCDPAASKLLASARGAHDEAEQSRLLGEAEQKIVAYVGYIPLGAPIRWALAGKRLSGFQASPRGIHPLNRLIIVPN